MANARERDASQGIVDILLAQGVPVYQTIWGSYLDRLCHADAIINGIPYGLRGRNRIASQYGEVTLTRDTEVAYLKQARCAYGYLWSYPSKYNGKDIAKLYIAPDVRRIVRIDPDSPGIEHGGASRNQIFQGWNIDKLLSMGMLYEWRF